MRCATQLDVCMVSWMESVIKRCAEVRGYRSESSKHASACCKGRKGRCAARRDSSVRGRCNSASDCSELANRLYCLNLYSRIHGAYLLSPRVGGVGSYSNAWFPLVTTKHPLKVVDLSALYGYAYYVERTMHFDSFDHRDEGWEMRILRLAKRHFSFERDCAFL